MVVVSMLKTAEHWLMCKWPPHFFWVLVSPATSCSLVTRKLPRSARNLQHDSVRDSHGRLTGPCMHLENSKVVLMIGVDSEEAAAQQTMNIVLTRKPKVLELSPSPILP